MRIQTKTRRLAGIILKAAACGTLALLAACSGTIDGVIRGEGGRVTFRYEQGMDRDFYEAIIDGERFKGQAVRAYARSGNFVAVMFGDRGSTIRCKMNYADSSGFTSMGGVGICRHSDGRIFDVMW